MLLKKKSYYKYNYNIIIEDKIIHNMSRVKCL